MFKIFLAIFIILFGSITQAIDLPKGYLLVQEVKTRKQNAISALETANLVFSNIKGRVDGVEFVTQDFDDADLTTHKMAADVAKKYGIDLWGSSYHLALEKTSQFGNWKRDNPQFVAYKMNKDGSIVMVDGLFDTLNPEAVAWFIAQYKTKYLIPFKGILKGYFINEDVIFSFTKDNKRFPYYDNATYSPSVLKQWLEYCKTNNIKYNNIIVDKFPVDKRQMVNNGNGQTQYFPDYNIPEYIMLGTRFVDIKQPQGVWKAWYDFISKLFIENWIVALARAANQVNSDNPDWYGVIYFGLHHWTLPYEEIENRNFTVPFRHQWKAWGRQRGIDLAILASQPEIKVIVCETYPKIIEGNLENFISEYKRIVTSNGRLFGLMVHRDDNWKLNIDEEKERFRIINKYQPQIIVRYPLWWMYPTTRHYIKDMEDNFSKNINEYKNR